MNEKVLRVQEKLVATQEARYTFFFAILHLLRRLKDGETIRLEFVRDDPFNPVPYRFKNEQERRREEREAIEALTPEVCWSMLPDCVRTAVDEVSDLIAELEWHLEQNLQVRRVGEGYQICLALKFSRPVGGYATTN